jgi:hypothetical protein
MPVTGRCTKFGYCEKADSKELITVPDGSEPKCPECDTALSIQSGGGDGWWKKIVIFGGAAAVIVALLIWLWPFDSRLVPVITNSPLTAIWRAEEQFFKYQIEATNQPTKYEATGLPEGLTLNQETGEISGSNRTAARTFRVTLSATNAAGPGKPATLTLTIEKPSGTIVEDRPVITGLQPPSGQLGQPFKSQIQATNQPTKYAATGLPPGLTLDSTTGLISGIPTKADTFRINLIAANAAGPGDAVTLTLIISSGGEVPVITSPQAASGQVGQSFKSQIEATNQPTKYAATGLPPGLTLDPTTGLISGIPTQEGPFRVTLSAANAAGKQGTATCTITIALNETEGQLAKRLADARFFTQSGRQFIEGKSPDFRKAINEFSAAIKALPSYALAWLGRGIAYMSLGQDYYDEAMHDLTEAESRFNPQDRDNLKFVYFNIAVLCTRIKQFGRAMNNLEKAIDHGLDDPRQLRCDSDLVALKEHRKREFEDLMIKYRIAVLDGGCRR